MPMYLSKISTERTLCHSRAFSFVLSEFAELVAAGRAELELPFANASVVTYGLDGSGKVVAACVHSYDAGKRSHWIQFSAVAREHRGNGAYGELVAEVKRQAREFGAVNIYTGVATNNDEMLTVADKMGRQAAVMRFRIALD